MLPLLLLALIIDVHLDTAFLLNESGPNPECQRGMVVVYEHWLKLWNLAVMIQKADVQRKNEQLC